ncbi:hypothetical protein C8Q78DRAFT_762505 [Trametes maxima]|nr:hypothetical protein C8Q78DRAFT_762505 [Trametes maxima]
MRRDSALAVNVAFSVATRTASTSRTGDRAEGLDIVCDSTIIVGAQDDWDLAESTYRRVEGPPIPKQPRLRRFRLEGPSSDASKFPRRLRLRMQTLLIQLSKPQTAALPLAPAVTTVEPPRTIPGLPSTQQYRMSIVARRAEGDVPLRPSTQPTATAQRRPLWNRAAPGAQTDPAYDSIDAAGHPSAPDRHRTQSGMATPSGRILRKRRGKATRWTTSRGLRIRR